MVPQAMEAECNLRRRQHRLRNWFTLFWLLTFSYVSQALAFGPLDILTASGGERLLIFLGAFASFLAGFVAFDHLMARMYPSYGPPSSTTLRRGRQI